MKISVIGTGYVGLVSGVCLAEKGHQVVCVDIDEEKVKKINSSQSPIHEDGLENLLKKNLGKTFNAITDLKKAVLKSDLSLIAVGTPFDGEVIDLKYIKQVAKEIGTVLKEKNSFHTVIVKSTVVPGTTDDVVLPILEDVSGKKAGLDFGVGMNPEFLREGEAVSDFMNPGRIVIGGSDEKTLSKMHELYQVFSGVDILKTNNKTAEMIKYTANSLLATLISFSNEIGNLCHALENVDVTEVMEGVHKDKRFMPILPDGERVRPGLVSYLAAGCGFGGSCFPKDVKALIAHGKAKGLPMELLDSVININKRQPQQVLSLLEKNVNELNELHVTVLGLAFKPGTDDMRESPSIPIIEYLMDKGAKIEAYDPVAENEARKIFGNEQIHYHKNIEEALENTDVVILLTSWQEFQQVPGLLKDKNPQPLFIDGRRMLPKDHFENYEGIGLS